MTFQHWLALTLSGSSPPSLDDPIQDENDQEHSQALKSRRVIELSKDHRESSSEDAGCRAKKSHDSILGEFSVKKLS